jgi:hypothetical protein
VWRRLSARQDRTFDDAFAGVFGQSPRALYGRFLAEVTANAAEAARLIRAGGADTGTIEQRLALGTGDPAVSRDGGRMAIVLRSPLSPPRVVIWDTKPEPDTGRARRDSILLARDPEDVPARPIFPPPKRVLASLMAPGGASYESPRFLADGRVLLTRNTAEGNGSLRPDLYVWDPQRHRVRRVTHGVSVLDPDPMADGRSAVATRCRGGTCDVVRVDLATGSVGTLAAGTAERSFYRPRVRPGTSEILVSMHEGAKWRLALIDADTHAVTPLAIADDANHYDAAWSSATTIVDVSDRGGIANLERITLPSLETRPLTRVTGAAVAPEPDATNGKIWFLSLHSGGYDLRSVAATSVASDVATLPPTLAPVAPTPVTLLRTFSAMPIAEPRAYNPAPTTVRWLPQPIADADGVAGVLAIVGTDVVGKAEVLGQGAWGDASQWRGGAIAAAWRGTRPSIRAQIFDAAQRPSETRTRGSWPGAAGLLDARLAGAELAVDGTEQYDTWAARYRLGATAARLHRDSLSLDPQPTSRARVLGFADAGGAWYQRGTTASASENLGANLALGRTLGSRFARGIVSAGWSTSSITGVGIGLSALYGRVSGGDAFESFSLGGGASSLLDRATLAQRIEMPVLPAGIRTGSSVLTYRVALPTRPLSLYYWGGSTRDGPGRFAVWNRVIGLESTQSVSAVPVLGTPPARARFGIGESVDAPFRHRVRAYVSLLLEP